MDFCCWGHVLLSQSGGFIRSCYPALCGRQRRPGTTPGSCPGADGGAEAGGLWWASRDLGGHAGAWGQGEGGGSVES